MTITYDELRAEPMWTNPYLIPAETRVRYWDRNWNEISANQIGQDLGACTLTYAVRKRPATWGMPGAARLPQLPGEPTAVYLRRTLSKDMDTDLSILLAGIASLIAHGIPVGPWWMSLDTAVDKERRRLLEQSVIA